jgi:hypothetical protein
MHALEACTDEQRAMFMRVHGITPQGATNQVSAAEIARERGVSRQTAHEQLNAARLEVYRQIALELIERERRREDEQAMPVPGITTLDENEARTTFVRYTVRTEQRVNLGPGSQAMERVEKHGPGTATDTMRIQAHKRYAR